jgi:hypothetical protein
MTIRNVIVELKYTAALAASAQAGEETGLGMNPNALPTIETLQYDPTFSPVPLPKLVHGTHPDGELFDSMAAVSLDLAPSQVTYLVRGTIDDTVAEAVSAQAAGDSDVVNIYSDVAISPMIVCPGSAAVGTDLDVERLLCTSAMHSSGMDGSGVLVAIVDTGVNMAYLNSKGKTPTFDAARSWAWSPTVTPGSAPVDHGTMCAYDACIAAPRCTLLDIALLHPISAPVGGTIMSALLSDAIRAYNHLLGILTAPPRPGATVSMVVNNSWGMFHTSWDFPVGHPGNYSDNPAHPFNVIVASLERAGADILFAAGNCGADCPDGRCRGVTANTIYGANSSASVLSVAGVDTTRARVGYSAIGPGRLTTQKPDISGYTHFRGSGVYAADGGTSAACPVVAGVVAAVRSRRPYNPTDSSTSPAAIRSLVTTTAVDLGPAGYDYSHGFGVVDGCTLRSRLVPTLPPIDICVRFPILCRLSICDRFPRLCRPIDIRLPPIPRFPPIPPIGPRPGLGMDASVQAELQDLASYLQNEAEGDGLSADEIAYLVGFLDGQSNAPSAPPPPFESPRHKRKHDDCGC